MLTRPVPLSTPAVNTAVGRAAGSRGGPGRVAAVHAQTRRGLLVAAGFSMLAAVITGIASVGAGEWLPLHLFVVGGLLSGSRRRTDARRHPLGCSLTPASRGRAHSDGPLRLVLSRSSSPRDRPDVDVVAGGATVVIAMLAGPDPDPGGATGGDSTGSAPAIEADAVAAVVGVAGMSLWC